MLPEVKSFAALLAQHRHYHVGGKEAKNMVISEEMSEQECIRVGCVLPALYRSLSGWGFLSRGVWVSVQGVSIQGWRLFQGGSLSWGTLLGRASLEGTWDGRQRPVKQEYIPVGCVLSAAVAVSGVVSAQVGWGVCPAGGCLLSGVSAQRVCLLRCLPKRVSAWGCTPPPALWTESQTGVKTLPFRKFICGQ